MRKTAEMVKQEVATDAIIEAGEAQDERTKGRFWQVVGAIKLALNLRDSLHSKVVESFDVIKEDKLYLAAGHKTFDGFMDSDPESPMPYKTFLAQRGVLQIEGPEVFDHLTALGVPISRRKALKPGSIQIEGDTIIVGEERAALTDRRRIIEIVRALADKTDAQSKKLDKGAANLDKQKKKYEALKKNPGSVDLALKQGPGEALMTLLGFYATFREQVELLSDADREKLRNPAMELISNQHEMLAHTLGVANTKKRPAKAKADSLAQLNAEFGTSITQAALDALDDED